jgi:hypothetical protein
MRWFAKASTQAVLARVWGGERINHFLQRINGTIGSPATLAKRVQYGLGFLERNADLIRPEGKHVMEIGTGWDAIHTILLAALGADRITTLDHIPHVRLRHALQVAQAWRVRTRELSLISGQPEQRIKARLESILQSADLSSLFRTMNAQYVAPGDICATGLPPGSVDMVYGYAVLAHLPRSVLEAFCKECARVLVPGGISVQRIGLEDPFNDWNGGDFVDFLKHSPRVWRLIGEHSITFHNRLRSIEFLQVFEAQGGVTVRATETIPPESLARARTIIVAKQFRHFTPEQLAVTAVDLVSRFGEGGLGSKQTRR